MTSCWRHGEIFDVITNLLTSWYIFNIITNFFNFLRHHELFNVFLTSQRTFWLHDKLFDMMTCFDFMTNFWLVFDVMTNLFTSWRRAFNIFDLMTCFLIFWRNDVLFGVYCDVITYFLQSWRTLCKSWWHDLLYWRNDILLMSYTFWHIPFHHNSLTYCTCVIIYSLSTDISDAYTCNTVH